eukprot:7906190-Pyramimonas_sp.AAC.1
MGFAVGCPFWIQNAGENICRRLGRPPSDADRPGALPAHILVAEVSAEVAGGKKRGVNVAMAAVQR